ncbi:aminoglycoside 6-adenylyltransferase [Sporosarcina luteola]|uniref:aminoglycoside 6-adenylyltransferase n=1 Tax=Sporosarcina luteola TaxID=582850 RepID=UPI00203BFD4A|nr:aminoglycoside 6-adenylyltransferase [Sporosarcina luteola]MCM3744881.1 aminoglycoside 6-adenylyltransferase [Sporosarcina luteola]
MYSSDERNEFFIKTVEKLESSNLVEGVIQLGSGTIGYKDEYSDIDVMVSTSKAEDVESTKSVVHQILREFNPIYIKEKQFSRDIYLLIAFMENSLEFNVSILPSELLNVKSPLWKVIVDKTGFVSEKMNAENEVFQNKPIKYNVNIDIVFEFAYCALSLDKELKRNNLIYALKMLENMRDYVLLVQAMNENKKLHQFKAYDTLDPSFIEEYLSTYQDEITVEKLKSSSKKLKELFTEVVDQSSSITMDNELHQLLHLPKG